MEYIFGIVDEKQVLRTKGPSHTDLHGWCATVRTTDVDQTRDDFFIVKKINSAEDEEGNCYDWYEITNHNSVIEYRGQIVNLETRADDMENAMCDTDAENEERLAEIENALCELDERG